jgi:translation initiation factor IF-3
VAVPRRFDRRLPERDQTRINERIRVPEVRVIDDEGNQVGVMKTPDALKFAQERDLDLVEVAPEAKPPVCRVLDYSKYKYEQAQKVKQARKHQQQITVREIKFRPKIAEHDYDTKKHHVERFLRHKDKVKITIMFRGREVTHPERGVMILDRLAEELSELGVVEQRPTQDGRNMTMMLAPSKAVLAGKADGAEATPEASEGEQDGAGVAPQAVAGAQDGASPETAEAGTQNGAAASPETAEAGTQNGAAAAPETVETGVQDGADAAPETAETGVQDGADAAPEAAVSSGTAAATAVSSDEVTPVVESQNGAGDGAVS